MVFPSVEEKKFDSKLKLKFFSMFYDEYFSLPLLGITQCGLPSKKNIVCWKGTCFYLCSGLSNNLNQFTGLCSFKKFASLIHIIKIPNVPCNYKCNSSRTLKGNLLLREEGPEREMTEEILQKEVERDGH